MNTHTSWRRGGLAVLLLALVVVGCSAQAAPTATPTAPQSPTESPAPTPIDSPTPAPSETPSVAWRPASVPQAREVSSVTAVIGALDGRLVAIGFDGGFGSILWASEDGQHWTDVTPAEFAGYGLAGVVQLEDLIVAVGRGNTLDVDANLAAVYLSEDGLTWRPASTRFFGQLIDVISTDDGLYAVGGLPTGDSAGVWHSPDGDSWTQISADLEHAFLWSIAEGGPGLVAVGWRRNPDPDLAVWTSADGESWELAPDPEGFEDFEAHDVRALPDGTLVMAGSAFDGSGGRIWTSTDGVTWELADYDGGGGAARALVETPAGLVALGARDMSAVAWISTDGGRSWAQLGDEIPDAYLNNAYMTDGGVLHLLGGTQEGTLETGITGRAMIWTGTLD